MILSLLFALIFQQDTIPYKPSDEFEIKLDYQFKMRPVPSSTEFKFNEDATKKQSTAPLPYLVLELEILKASSSEERLRGTNDNRPFLNKRGIKSGTKVQIDMGFTADMKDRVTPHEYVLIFADNKKKETSKIVIFIGEDGSFLVNGEKRGQF